MKCVRFLALSLTLAATSWSVAAQDFVTWSAEERRTIESLGPWPLPWQPDASNRFSGNATAIAWGRRLFFDTRLSSNGKVSCASCHVPAKGFTDGRATAFGQAAHTRNAQSVINARYQRWFGWDGASDSLWSHALRPLFDPREHGLSETRLASIIRRNKDLTNTYQQLTGVSAQGVSPDAISVNVAKALAAYQETLVSPRTAFDQFRDALIEGNVGQQAAYSLAAQRGLKIFVGRGQCTLCHFGPLLSSREFADVGVRFFTADGKVDPGRYAGIKVVKTSKTSRASAWSDDVEGRATSLVNHVALHPRMIGEWKVPSLRGLTQTGPYMHNGSLPSIRAVVEHYNTINPDRLHQDGLAILRPLGLSTSEINDLVTFLESLSTHAIR